MHRRQFILGAASLAIASPAIADEEALRLRKLYEKDMSFSPLAHSLDGERVSILGFMAPPLKAESTFFVLTNRPMAVCPFCESEAEWPDDILAVYTKRTLRVVPYNVRIEARGTLELGTFKDLETGFVSRVRLRDTVYGRA